MQFTQSEKKDRFVPYFVEVMAGFSRRITAASLSLIVALIATMFLIFAGLFPSLAWAEDYTISKTVINSSVTKEGDLHVSETRTITLSKKDTVLSWCFENVPSGSFLSVKKVSVVEGEGEYSEDASLKGTSFEGKGGYPVLDNAIAVAQVAFNPEWEKGLSRSETPETLSYSYDSASNTFYVFTQNQEGTYTLTVEYVLENGAQVYQDVTDMYWKFIPADWKCSSSSVFIQMALPVPEQVTIEPGTTIRAWSHGSPDAEIMVDQAKGAVLFYTPEIKQGNYAELRAVFPADWISYSNTSGGNIHINTSQLNSILAQERSWKDNDAYWTQKSYTTVLASVLVVILIVFLGLLSARRFTKEQSVSLPDSYWYKAPEKDLPAAVVSRLINKGKPHGRDFVVSVMELVEKGHVTVKSKGSDADECVFRLNSSADKPFENDLERRTAALLFEEIGEGKSEVSLSEIKAYVNTHGPKVFESWNSALTLRFDNEGLIERYCKLRYPRLIALGLLGLIALAVCYLMTKNVLALVPGVIAYGVVVFALYPLTRISLRGVEIGARLEGLKRWFEHLEKLNTSAIVTEEKSWPELYKYVYLLGLDEQVIGSLSRIGFDKIPQSALINEEQACKALESLIQ